MKKLSYENFFIFSYLYIWELKSNEYTVKREEVIVRVNVVEEVKKKFGERCSEEIYKYVKDLVIEKPDSKVIDELIIIKKLFSNRIRISILILLSQAALPVCALVSILNVDQTLISHNLSMLKRLGIAKEERIGKYRVYSLNKKKLKRILQNAISAILS